MLIPRQAVPSLELPTIDHGLFSLAKDQPKTFTLVVFLEVCIAPCASST
jgi:hypothetical protein